ncbi:MAG: SDR family oxidoreductase [Rhodothalassiaceae bacterium]
MTMRFDGRVAIVTGAGGGLGRAHALAFARLGARVVVNDLGAALDGTGGASEAAGKVVEEIRAGGGEAVANGASVADPEGARQLIADAIEAFGRVDILVNNAGILRDKTFAKMSLEDFAAVLDVHLMGSVLCTHAAWPSMREQGYGRVVFTTSSSGLYGNFGQSNYGAAKMGLVGLMNVLRLEGARDGIHVNAVAPIATTRMTEDLFPAQIRDLFAPELVTPAVLFLAHEKAPNGQILSAGGGHFACARMVETKGSYLGPAATPEAIAAAWDGIADMSGAEPLENGPAQTQKFALAAMTAMARE